MLGCDIISVARVRRSFEKHGESFINRILTDAEKEIFVRRNQSMTFLAGRFAAKEAVSKAFKTGIGELAFTDIEILHDANGAPYVMLKGKLFTSIEISISHCDEYAIAVCAIKENGGTQAAT